MGAHVVRGGRPEHAGRVLRPRPWWSGPEVIDPAAPGAPFDLVLLDRDGTLNVRVEDGYVTDPGGLVLLPGAADAVARITETGCRTVLVTNQRAVARALMTRPDLEAVNRCLVEEVTAAGGRLDGIAVCPHGEGECDCRKPRTGLFVEALSRAPWADPARCLMVGDMPSDLEPAALLGMRTMRVDTQVGLSAVVDRIAGRQGRDDRPAAVRRGEGHVP